MTKIITIPYRDIVSAVPPEPHTNFTKEAWQSWLEARGVKKENIVEAYDDVANLVWVCKVKEDVETD